MMNACMHTQGNLMHVISPQSGALAPLLAAAAAAIAGFVKAKLVSNLGPQRQ